MTLFQRFPRLAGVALGYGTHRSALSQPIFCLSRQSDKHEGESHGKPDMRRGHVRHEQEFRSGRSNIGCAPPHFEPAQEQKSEVTICARKVVQPLEPGLGANERVNRKLWPSVPLMLRNDTLGSWFRVGGLRKNTTSASVDALAPQTKTCVSCGQSKQHRDFPTSVSSPDGRHILCRACKEEFFCKRWGKPFHLGLSLAESRDAAKVCSICKVKKELRDFSFRSRAKKTLRNSCRACVHEANTQKVAVVTQAEQVCASCHTAKPADAFYQDRLAKSGLNQDCKECFQRKESERRKALSSSRQDFPWRASGGKICPHCKQKKDRTQFSQSRQCSDGLFGWCRACNVANLKVIRRQKKTMGREG